MMEYAFDKELQEARIVKRNSQFTMNIDLNGEVVKARCIKERRSEAQAEIYRRGGIVRRSQR